ncbi:hypothetical protein I4Y90_004454 [Salmonella enterica subsp. enterica serovar Adelaide]|nr:hypothetical protein [Salmonella enterica]EEQ1475323.1 hypothetical protein [Salmonella enterica]EGR8150671.1 hypothetical protein [Salmonella enterica subsp. enterica serovar Adelaide]
MSALNVVAITTRGFSLFHLSVPLMVWENMKKPGAVVSYAAIADNSLHSERLSCNRSTNWQICPAIQFVIQDSGSGL